jgi:hypothetical protein
MGSSWETNNVQNADRMAGKDLWDGFVEGEN